MTSKEALENLTYCVNGMERKEKYYKIIKQDLDRLETFDYIAEQNVKLKEENNKLKEALDTLIRKLDIRLTKTENYDTAETYYSVYNDNACEVLYPEEYELLKEVLGNEK